MRMRELEVLRAQLDKMHEYRQNWTEKQTQLQRALQDAEKNAQIEKERFESELVLLSETAELATLDKNVAEEKVRCGVGPTHVVMSALPRGAVLKPNICPVFSPPRSETWKKKSLISQIASRS